MACERLTDSNPPGTSRTRMGRLSTSVPLTKLAAQAPPFKEKAGRGIRSPARPFYCPTVTLIPVPRGLGLVSATAEQYQSHSQERERGQRHDGRGYAGLGELASWRIVFTMAGVAGGMNETVTKSMNSATISSSAPNTGTRYSPEKSRSHAATPYPRPAPHTDGRWRR